MFYHLFSGMVVLGLGVSPLQSAPTPEVMESLTSTNEPLVSQDFHLPSMESSSPTTQSDNNNEAHSDNMELGPDNLRDGRGITENLKDYEKKLQVKLNPGISGRPGVLSKVDKAMDKLQLRLEDMMDKIQSKFEIKGNRFLTKMGEMMDKIGDKVGSVTTQKVEEVLEKTNQDSADTLQEERTKVVTKRDSDDLVVISQQLNILGSIEDVNEDKGDDLTSSQESPSKEGEFFKALESELDAVLGGDEESHTDSDEVEPDSRIRNEAEGFEVLTLHTDQGLLDQLSLLMPQSADEEPYENGPSPNPSQRLEIFEVHQVVQNEPNLSLTQYEPLDRQVKSNPTRLVPGSVLTDDDEPISGPTSTEAIAKLQGTLTPDSSVTLPIAMSHSPLVTSMTS